MEKRWSLKELYPSFESVEFKTDLKKCEEMIEQFNQWGKENLHTTDGAQAKLEGYINQANELYLLFTRLYAFVSLTLSVETKHETALQMREKMQKMNVALTPIDVQFRKWVTSLENLEEKIDGSELLKEHCFALSEIVESGKYLLSEKEEQVIAEMDTTGATSWTNLHQNLTSNLMVDIELDGEVKKLPLSVIRNMAYESDVELRKKAYEAELKGYEKIDESIAAALNGIKGQVITIAKMRGYDSPLDETLLKSRMDRETLEAMLTAMKESLPAFHKYFQAKAKLLGHKGGLPFYDMFAPIGSVDMTFSYEESRDYIVDNMKKFSTKWADFMAHAFDNQWIDAEPREGKIGGAFCSNLKPIKASRILSNFTGSFSDMITLAHELGHAYHGDCLLDETMLNSEYPMPLAETASIFSETIIFEAALKSVNDDEALVILENSVSGAAQVIVDILSRYLFETEVFNRRKDHSLSVSELKEVMLDAQKEAYGDGLDHDCLHPYMWIPKIHYYHASLNFYNFPYAFGLLFAKGLYAEYLKQGDPFIDKFDQLLAATGKNKVGDVTKMIDIDVTSVDFWRASLKLIEEEIERFVELCDRA